LAGFYATIEKMVSSFSSNNKDRDERGAAMWRAYLVILRAVSGRKKPDG
jgi:hypothetical protein